MNLVRNAAEAQGSEGRIVIRTRRGDSGAVVGLSPELGDSTDVLVVSVADQGPGVDPEVAPHIFDAYASTRGEGRGLGLATVEAFAAANGGGVAARSTQEGATFEIALPVR